MQLEFNQQNV